MMCQKLFALALFSMLQAVLMMQAEREGLDKAWEDVKYVLKGKGNIDQELGELVPLVAVRMHEERKVSPTICKHFPDAEICNNAEDRSIWHKIKHGVEKVGHDIAKGAEKVGHDIGKVAEKGWNKTKHWTENEWNKVKPEVEKELDKVLDSVKDKVKDEAGKVLDKVKDKLGDEAGKALKDVKNIFKGKGNIGKEIAEVAEELAEEAVEIVPEIL